MHETLTYSWSWTARWRPSAAYVSNMRAQPGTTHKCTAAASDYLYQAQFDQYAWRDGPVGALPTMAATTRCCGMAQSRDT